MVATLVALPILTSAGFCDDTVLDYVIRLRPPIQGLDGRLDGVPVGASDAEGWLYLGAQLAGSHKLAMTSQGVACGDREIVLDPELNAVADFDIQCLIVDLDTNVAGAEVRIENRLVTSTGVPSAAARVTLAANRPVDIEVRKEGFDPEVLHLDASPAGLIARRVTLRPLAAAAESVAGKLVALIAVAGFVGLGLFLLRRRTGGKAVVAPSGDGGNQPDPGLPQVPFSFDRYQVVAFLARGGLASVYRAIDVSNANQVALKILDSAWHADTETLFKFLGEGEMLRRIRQEDENAPVPKFLRSGREGGRLDGVPYLAMELLAGETLAERIRRLGALPEREAVLVGTAVARVLASAHRAGILHRDVSPENVLVAGPVAGSVDPLHEGTALRVSLIDFGSARADWGEEASLDLTISGKPRYMSPEQSSGRSVDGRSDLYSLGVVLYTMIRARPPFDGATVETYQELHSHSIPDSLEPEATPAFSEVVARLLSKAPDDRPQDADEVLLALSRIRKASIWGLGTEPLNGDVGGESTWRM